jgi:hypothetical protein
VSPWVPLWRVACCAAGDATQRCGLSVCYMACTVGFAGGLRVQDAGLLSDNLAGVWVACQPVDAHVTGGKALAAPVHANLISA